jgi:hypothetical protein
VTNASQQQFRNASSAALTNDDDVSVLWVSESPAATADTIGGVALVLESGPGQDAEGAPLAVHANGEGLGVGVTCELPPPVEPQSAGTSAAA